MNFLKLENEETAPNLTFNLEFKVSDIKTKTTLFTSRNHNKMSSYSL